LEAKGLSDGATVTLRNATGDVLVIAVKQERHIEGMIPYLPTFDTKIDVSPFFKEGYRFARVTLQGA
jgi:NADH-quinone oxidoreductase subunit G